MEIALSRTRNTPDRFHINDEKFNAVLFLKVFLVIVLATIKASNAMIQGVVNSMVVLPCAIEEGLDVESVKWTHNYSAYPFIAYFPKDGHIGPPGYDQRFSTSDPTEMILASLQKSDRGAYTCIVTSLDLPNDLQYTVNLTVLEGCELWSYNPPLHGSEDGCSSGNLLHYAQTCSFSCHEGFNLFGNASTKCMGNGNLNSSPPNCEAINCRIDSLPSHLIDTRGVCLNQSNVEYGTVCLFECATGYRLTGNGTVKTTCDEEGGYLFYRNLPECEEMHEEPLQYLWFIAFVPFLLASIFAYWFYKKKRDQNTDENFNFDDHPLSPLLQQEKGFMEIICQQVGKDHQIMKRTLKILHEAERKLIEETPNLKCKPVKIFLQDSSIDYSPEASFAWYLFVILSCMAQNNPTLAEETIDNLLAATGDNVSETHSRKTAKSLAPSEGEDIGEIEDNEQYLSAIHAAFYRLLVALRHSFEDEKERRIRTSEVFGTVISHHKRKHPSDSEGRSSKSDHTSSWHGSSGDNGIKSNQFFADRCLGDMTKCTSVDEDIQLRFTILSILLEDTS